MQIIAFHMLNDFSGSPKVLEGVLEGLIEAGDNVELFTSSGGVLDRLPDSSCLRRHKVRYSFSRRNLPLSFLKFIRANTAYFFRALAKRHRADRVFYINTIMPFGAAIGAKLRGNRVVYHCHENAYAKGVHYRIYSRLMEWLADDVICVSNQQAAYLNRSKGIHVVPNSLDPQFVACLKPDPEAAFRSRTLLMVCSLRGYKGISQFVRLAEMMPDLNFSLVINEEKEVVEHFCSKKNFSRIHNLTVHARTHDVARHYNSASLLLNLSDPRKIVETFGMTAIEGMAAALPAIVPTQGGIASLVDDGVNGYRIDSDNLQQISRRIQELLSDKALYKRFAANALAKSASFSRPKAVGAIRKILMAQLLDNSASAAVSDIATSASAASSGRKGEVILMCGVSGSGKTFLSRKFEKEGYRRISLDENIWKRYGDDFAGFPEERRREILMKASLEIEAMVSQALDNNEKIVVDSTLCKRAKRDRIREICADRGVMPRFIYLDAPLSLIMQRLAGRGGTGPNDQIVPEASAEQFYSNFDRPAPEETDIQTLQE